MASDAPSFSDSVKYAPRAEQNIYYSNDDMKDFQSIKQAFDRSITPQHCKVPIILTDAQDSPLEELNLFSKELADLLKKDTTDEDAKKTFEEFMTRNSDAVYSGLQNMDPNDDPLQAQVTMSDSLNAAAKDSRYSFDYDLRSGFLFLKADGKEIAEASVAPDFNELMGLPPEYR